MSSGLICCIVNQIGFASGVLDQTNNNNKKNNDFKKEGNLFLSQWLVWQLCSVQISGTQALCPAELSFLLIIQYGRVYISNRMTEEGIKKKVGKRHWREHPTLPHRTFGRI